MFKLIYEKVAWVPIHRSFDVDYFLLGISGEVNKLPKVTLNVLVELVRSVGWYIASGSLDFAVSVPKQ